MGQEDKPVVNREGLKSFLEKNRSDGVTEAEIDKAMETIGGLFIQAERKQFQFTPADEVNKEAIARAIALATGRKVEKIELLSVSKPFNGLFPNDAVIFKTSGRKIDKMEPEIHLFLGSICKSFAKKAPPCS